MLCSRGTMSHAGGGLLPCFATSALAPSTPPPAPSIRQQQRNRRQLFTRAARMLLPSSRRNELAGSSSRLSSWGGESGYDYVDSNNSNTYEGGQDPVRGRGRRSQGGRRILTEDSKRGAAGRGREGRGRGRSSYQGGRSGEGRREWDGSGGRGGRGGRGGGRGSFGRGGRTGIGRGRGSGGRGWGRLDPETVRGAGAEIPVGCVLSWVMLAHEHE